MRELFKEMTADQADTCGLVLSSSGIAYRVKRGRRGWEIWVEESVYDSALARIQEYFAENREDAPADTQADRFIKTYTGIWVALFLLAWNAGFISNAGDSAWIHAYGSGSDGISRGEYHRIVTALTIHADPAHLAGNLVGIAVFGTAVCGTMGWGVGWLLILLTGMTGNFLNAALLRAGHLSVGASTAIFGAIGIMAGHQCVRRLGSPGKRVKAWLPLAGGLALLGFLGSGVHTDVTAHLFGFLSGMVLGLVYAVFVRRPVSHSGQILSMALCIGIVGIAWLTAFSRS